MDWSKRSLRLALSGALSASLVLATAQTGRANAITQPTATPSVQEPSPGMGIEAASDLSQLVAPIALYPDNLVAQILAASALPDEVVEANQWIQQYPGLSGADLAQAVNRQPWDPGVKALTQFPPVLANLATNRRTRAAPCTGQ
jgi:hypothetical protein